MMLQKFLSSDETSLKICGVTLESDALRLLELGVDAVGFNFWPQSKRFLDPEEGGWLEGLAGKILRVGVFVNEEGDLPFSLIERGMIDVVQLHGDEGPEVTKKFAEAGVPVIRAIGVRSAADFERAGEHGASAILLDAYAPRVFGGTGAVFDWDLAKGFQEAFPSVPMILAGGITPENGEEAVRNVMPAALDVASGAELSPGIKDFEKVRSLMAACGGGV